MRNGNRLYTYNQSLDKTQFEVRMPKIYNDKYQYDTVDEDSLELVEDLFNIVDIHTKCDNKQTNADRIRNMSDEELAEFMQKMEYTCFVDFIGYADKGCGRNEISCKDCRAKAPTILEWLQSEAE